MLLTLLKSGIPEDIMSDRGPQFTSRVFKSLCNKLNILLSLTSAYHAQSGGLAERTNQEVLKALRLLCEDKPTEWVVHLVWAEYALNTHTNPVTHMSLFQCILGYSPPLFPWEADPSEVPQVEEWYYGATHVWQGVQRVLSHQASKQKAQADRRRIPVPPYQVDQWVWLSTCNLKNALLS